MTLYTGTSGWSYPQWKGAFYPPGLPSRAWLTHYASHFETVEINSTFYRLPLEKTLRGWAGAVPEHFRFSVKAWREITHHRKLRDAEEPLAQFLARTDALGEKRGPVLFQLPPSLQEDAALLEYFLHLLPTHIPCVFEFRHPSWEQAHIKALLRAHNRAWCQSLLKSPRAAEATADFTYTRLHGAQALYKGMYDAAYLAALAVWLEKSGATTHYCYFNNTMLGTDAIENARALSLAFGAPGH